MSDVSVSTDAAAPAILTQGMVAVGLVFDEGEQTNNFYSFDVPPGDYALVVEPFNTDTVGDTNLIMDVNEVDGNGDVLNEVVEFNEVDIRARRLLPVTVDSSGFTVQVETSFSVPRTYLIALYAQDDLIPTPFLADCPEITAVSLDTTNAFTLIDTDNASEYFQIELPVGLYDIQIDSTVSSGDSTNIQFSVLSYSVSGDIESETDVGGPNEIDVTNTITETIVVANSGIVFLRWLDPITDYDIQFTVTEQ